MNKKFFVFGPDSSVIATQLLGPFLYKKNGKKRVKYIRFNEDSIPCTYAHSNMIEEEWIAVNRTVDQSIAVTKYENIIFTTSCTRTTVQQILQNQDFDFVPIFYFIVVAPSNKESVLSAFKTYKSICEMHKDAKNPEDVNPKVMFILNTVGNQNINIEFAYFFGNEAMELDFVFKNNIPNEDLRFIIFRTPTCLNISQAKQILHLELENDVKVGNPKIQTIFDSAIFEQKLVYKLFTPLQAFIKM
jgi:hypothetical protein